MGQLGSQMQSRRFMTTIPRRQRANGRGNLRSSYGTQLARHVVNLHFHAPSRGRSLAARHFHPQPPRTRRETRLHQQLHLRPGWLTSHASRPQ